MPLNSRTDRLPRKVTLAHARRHSCSDRITVGVAGPLRSYIDLATVVHTASSAALDSALSAEDRATQVCFLLFQQLHRAPRDIQVLTSYNLRPNLHLSSYILHDFEDHHFECSSRSWSSVPLRCLTIGLTAVQCCLVEMAQNLATLLAETVISGIVHHCLQKRLHVIILRDAAYTVEPL